MNNLAALVGQTDIFSLILLDLDQVETYAGGDSKKRLFVFSLQKIVAPRTVLDRNWISLSTLLSKLEKRYRGAITVFLT